MNSNVNLLLFCYDNPLIYLNKLFIKSELTNSIGFNLMFYNFWEVSIEFNLEVDDFFIHKLFYFWNNYYYSKNLNKHPITFIRTQTFSEIGLEAIYSYKAEIYFVINC